MEYLGRFLEGADLKWKKGSEGSKLPSRPALPGRPLKRPTFALLAEYDALPAVGDGCGHNLIAAAQPGSSSGSE